MTPTIKNKLEKIRKEFAEISELTNIKEQAIYADFGALVCQMAILAGETKIQ